MTQFKIGIVGYCPPTKYDRIEAWNLTHEGLMRALNNSGNKNIMVIGGLSAVGCIHEIGYTIARQNGWNCGGIASGKIKDYKWWPMSEDGDLLRIVGDNWGDESEDFIDTIDALIRIGGGPQSKKEVKMAKEKGIPVYEYELESE